jgi:predicted  nucleic acid-binding Zn-ribbon protein
MTDQEILHEMRELLVEERAYTKQMIQEELAPIKEDVSTLKTDMFDVKQDVSTLKTDMSEIKDRTKKIEFTLEHDVSNKIQSIYEGHQLNSDKLNQIQSSIDNMTPTVTALDVLHQMQKDLKR